MQRVSAVLVTLLFVLCACGGADTSFRGPGVEAGATAGGAQDLGLARKKVASGVLPAPEDFPVEGLYSEHDLPLTGDACADALCLRLASGTGLPVGATQAVGFSLVGLSSAINPDTFRRGPLNLAVVVDTSGSMAGEKLTSMKEALHKLVDRLDERDVLTLIEFESRATTLLGPEAVTDRARFHARVDSLDAGGGTCIECGLKPAYAAVSRDTEGRSKRVMLFTDARPNVGATDAGSFLGLVRSGAAAGVGLTAFGVGLDFGQALTLTLSAERGANAFFLADADRTRTLFDADFDFLVTPVAYDLSLTVTPSRPGGLLAAHGFPGETADLAVKTVFLSRNKGALTLRFAAELPQQKLAEVRLSWTGTDGVVHTSDLSALQPADVAPAFEQPAVRKAFALTELALAGRKVSELAKSDAAAARALATQLVDFLTAEAAATQDAGLAQELEFARALAALLPAQ